EKGFDSLLSVSLRVHLKQRYRIEVPPTLILGHPSVEAIARYVCQALGESVMQSGATRPAQRALRRWSVWLQSPGKQHAQCNG
ncbi:acyl carrier protein, partial [Pseudomonas aeruginosa]